MTEPKNPVVVRFNEHLAPEDTLWMVGRVTPEDGFIPQFFFPTKKEAEACIPIFDQMVEEYYGAGGRLSRYVK